MRDLYNNIEVRRALSPVATALSDDTVQTSEIIDMRGWKSMVFVILTGGLVDANAVYAVLIEDGDDSGLSDNVAVVDAELLGTESLIGFDFADDDDVRKIGYRGEKRYVRMKITPSGNSGDAPLAAIAIMGDPDDRPTTAQAD